MNRIHHVILTLSAASLFALTACESGQPKEEAHARAIQLIGQAHEARDYRGLMLLADSLQKTGDLSEPEAYYWLGYASERTHQLRMAEFYWKTAITQTGNATSPGQVAIYAKSASHLASVLGVRGEYDALMKMVDTTTRRLEELNCDTMSDYTNLLIYAGCCKSRFDMPEEVVNESFNRAYQKHLKNIEEHRSDEAYKNAIAGVVNIIFNYNETQSYRQAIIWLDHYAELIRQYELRNNADPSYVDRQWARYDIYRAIALDGLGKKGEAAEVYRHYLTTKYSGTPEGRVAANDYLTAAEQWAEVADNYGCLDALLKTKDYSLEDIKDMVLRKYHANMKTGRRDTAVAVSLDICEVLDSAISKARRQDAKEMLVIREKDQMLAEREAAAVQQRTNRLLATIAALFAAFSAYTVYRRQKTRHLVKKYKDLKATISEDQDTRTSEDRSRLEQNIVRNLQAALMPAALPRHDNVGLFATQKPASGSDCEFYDSMIRDDRLLFLMGNAKGQGAATPLGLSITREVFRSLPDGKTEPAEILETINKALVDRQMADMTVSLFIGILDLASGRLHYANAGHTAPMLVGSGIGLLPADKTPAAGTQAHAVFRTQESRIDPGTIICLYADSLMGIQNATGEKYNEKRMMGESLQAMKTLKEKLTPEAFVGWMQEALARFAPDGDFTMLVLQYRKREAGMPYQRSISLSNDPKDEPYIGYFATEVCAAIHLDQTASSEIEKALKDMVAGVIRQAYPEGTRGDVHIEAQSDGTTLDFNVVANGNEQKLTKNITIQ